MSSGGIELMRANGGGGGLGASANWGGSGGTATAHASVGRIAVYSGGGGGNAYCVVNECHNGGGGGSAGNANGNGVTPTTCNAHTVGGAAQTGVIVTGNGGTGYMYYVPWGLGSIVATTGGQGYGAGGGGSHDSPSGNGFQGVARMTLLSFP